MPVPQHELTLTYSRSSGPGGQNVNKVNSKATLRWNLAASRALPEEAKARFRALFPNRLTLEGDVVLSSDQFRDQRRNAEDCALRLEAMIAEALRPPKKRKRSKPTRSSVKRRIDSKRRHSEKKKLRRGD